MKIIPFLFIVTVSLACLYTLNYSAEANTQAPTGLKTTNDPQKEKQEPKIITKPALDFEDLLQVSNTIKAKTIIDGKTFTDYNGNTYSLGSLDIAFDEGTHQIASKELLEKLIKDKTLILFQTKKESVGRKNRLGHTVVHALREIDKAWVQSTLIANGLARVKTTSLNPEQATTLLKHEDNARQNKLGIWNDATYQILKPETANENIGAFHVVEGKVNKVAITKNNIYLNFGDDWKTDFTIGISSKTRKKISKKNISAQEWTHKKIRVRGWIRSYNGPYIELTHIEQIEFLENNK